VGGCGAGGKGGGGHGGRGGEAGGGGSSGGETVPLIFMQSWHFSLFAFTTY